MLYMMQPRQTVLYQIARSLKSTAGGTLSGRDQFQLRAGQQPAFDACKEAVQELQANNLVMRGSGCRASVSAFEFGSCLEVYG